MDKNKINASSPYFTGIVAIVLGVLMIIWPDRVMNYVIAITGWFLIIIGAVPIIISLFKKIPISFISVMYVVIGILILCFAHFFINIAMWVFGVILILGAVQQFNVMTQAKKTGALVPFTYIIYPAILLIAGVIILINPFKTISVLIVFFGISMLFYGITIIVTKSILDKSIKVHESQKIENK